MSDNNNDLLLSNGTCYFGAGQLADSNYLPCGNAYLEGPQACCYKNDYCLSSNTCWDPDTIVTYIAGCTDPTFRSANCPQRYNYPDQQWVALARCDGTDQDLWTGCAHHADKIELQKENCDCNKTNVLIQNPNGKGSFDEVGRLPNATLNALAWNPTAIPTALPQSSGSGGLSTGAKAGIGVGVGVGVLLLLAGASFLFLKRRRKNGEQIDSEKSELSGSTQYGSSAEKSELGDTHRTTSTDTGGQRSELSPELGIWEMESGVHASELESSSGYNSMSKKSTNYSQH